MFDLYDHQTQRFKFHVLDLKGFVHFRQTVRFVKKLAKLFDARNCCELKSSWLETFGVMEKIGRKKTKKHSLSNSSLCAGGGKNGATSLWDFAEWKYQIAT
ncbi:uncharacterized protein LOC113313135 isoform X2 [Papaver somniferum]|uniref:uncharacterized protein LOC113313135 isoform X2 n=1 Tax=Papaver somniferum TaxID=3469 RepID=UPI000E6FC301|nr:uncharacterized protein LOC113313135 isoform X2 [Papaver somniferum]